jgi:hypothetical protein
MTQASPVPTALFVLSLTLLADSILVQASGVVADLDFLAEKDLPWAE